MKKKEIGQAIKKARENAEMTQEAVAALFGKKLKPQAVNNWESGISFPRPERWAILEQGMGLPPGWFLELRTGAAPVVQVNGPVNGPLVAGVLQTAEPEPEPPRGDIARDLCSMITERLEGMDIEAQIALRARVKAALDEQRPRRAGLAGITLYSLRHIAASYLVMRGADIRTVAEIMGHANIATTSRYTHLLDAHRLAAIDRLDGLGG